MMLLAAVAAVAWGQLPKPPPPDHPILPQFYMPYSVGPALSEIRSSVRVSARTPGVSGDVILPTPGNYSGQQVIAFKVECDPPSALRSWKWEARDYAQNSAIDVAVVPPPEGATVSYTARVLTPGEGVVRTQTKDFKDWLAPSDRIASTNPGIVAIAKKLNEGHPEREELAKRTERWVAQNQTDSEFRKGGSDSLSALALGGNSLGRASLCAALFRANGVPGRLLAYSPTWATSVTNQDALFWLTEYETDDGAWDWVDPTVGILHLNRDSIVVMDVPAQSDMVLRSMSLGASLHPDWPFGSSPVATVGLTLSTPTAGFANTMHPMGTFPFASGARLLSGSTPRQREVIQSAMAGKDSWYDEAQFQAALHRGPIYLALFIDGRPSPP